MDNVKEIIFKRSSLSSTSAPDYKEPGTPRGTGPSEIPRVPSKQSAFTEEQIKEKLKGYRRIREVEELKVVRPSTWVKYFNTNIKEFRVGGVLTNNGYPNFFILKNPYSKKSWSVQLKDNVFFVPDTVKLQREKMERDELHRLYKEGKLKFVKE
jgi:hypothetical protein